MGSKIFDGPSVTKKDLDNLVNKGYWMLSRGQDEDALQYSRELLKKYPEEIPVLYFASEVFLIYGNLSAALEQINIAVRHEAGQSILFIQQAKILFGLRKRLKAQEAILKAVNISPDDIQILISAGEIMNQCGNFVEACGFFKKANRLAPDNPEILFSLASTLFFLGDMKSAEENLDILLKTYPEHGPAVYLRSMLRQTTAEHNHIAELQSRIDSGLKDLNMSVYFHFALAREYEEQGQYDAAFAALDKGAAIRRQHLDYDAKNEHASINDIIDNYTRDVFAATERGGCSEEGAIFIVGMPRTGTTLVERILASHSEVVPVGEVYDFPTEMTEQLQKILTEKTDKEMSAIDASLQMDFGELGRNYLKSVRQIAGNSRYFVDKLPFNFLYCGLIRKALPNARIIHVVRNPMDSCYAIYKTLFNQVYSFSYNLDELGEYYLLYRRLMKHWHQVMPGEIIDVAYEDIIQAPEKQARRLLEWCDLSWEESVLDFHSLGTASSTASAVQVRQPIYTSSVQKWTHYERQLEPLKRKFVDAGLIKEDGTVA